LDNIFSYHDLSAFFQMPILSAPSHPVYFNLSYLWLNLPHQLQRSQNSVPQASYECHCSKTVTTAYSGCGYGKLTWDVQPRQSNLLFWL